MKLSRILIVGMGGLFGSMLRYMISSAAALHFGDFPVGTMIVNVLGGFLMGFIMEACVGLWPVSAETRIFLTTGILGGFTTFSTFSYETVSLLSNGKWLLGGINATLNLFLALFACWLGKLAVHLLRQAAGRL